MSARVHHNSRKKAWDARRGGGVIKSTDNAQNASSVAISPRGGTYSSHSGRGCRHEHGRPVHSDATPEVIIPPPPPAPPLLLEGDEMHISKDGKSHTVYRLNKSSQHNNMLLEEEYDIERALKTISLIGPQSLLNDEVDDESMSADLFSFDLQEINDGVKNGVSTGCMTWESSVVMSLYFALNPDELCGKVIELGSGVGLGGIMSTVAKRFSCDNDLLSGNNDVNVTLTDVSDDVLNMLRQNMSTAAKSCDRDIFGENIHIQKLDWFDFLADDKNNSFLKEIDRYDTIIASDCAYLHSQITPLAEAISRLLREGGGKMHMFAPYNRGVIYELVSELRDVKNMHVQIEDIELSKHRIKYNGKRAPVIFSHDLQDFIKSQEISFSTSKFIHISAWHSDRSNEFDQNHGACGMNRMTDID